MSTFFWVLTPCSSVPARRFGGIYHFYVQDRRENQARNPAEAVCVAIRLHVLVSCSAYTSTPNTEGHVPPDGRSLSKPYGVITEKTVPFCHGRENLACRLKIRKPDTILRLYFYGSTSTRIFFFFSLALQPPWALASAFSFMIILGLLGRVISSSQGLYLNTE
jgi:hypothetical protein